MEAIDEEEELLSLRLALVTNPVPPDQAKRKRKRNEETFISSFKLKEGLEGKIFFLLQLREQMLKLDNKKMKGSAVEDGKGLHLIHLLLIAATAVDQNNANSAVDNLIQLYRNVSLTGDSVQRVAAYFADGLIARLLTRKSPFYDMINKEPTPDEQFFSFVELYKVSPYYQFAHFTANQSILETFEKYDEQNNDRALHVIDFDISYGLQWPSLMQSLSEKATAGNRISLRITGFSRGLEELRETETRLISFAKGFPNLAFEFQGLSRGSKLINLRTKKNETVAINLVFHLNTLNSVSEISESLKSVHSLNPSVVLLVEQEGIRSPKSFLSRFTETLHYFAAMFDSLDDCLPADSVERLNIEKNYLGKDIKKIVNCELDDLICSRYETLETWKGRMEEHGFAGIKLSSKSIMQAKLLLRIRSHYYSPIQFDDDDNNNNNDSSISGFRVIERDEGRAISLGWQQRCLLTASAWHCG